LGQLSAICWALGGDVSKFQQILVFDGTNIFLKIRLFFGFRFTRFLFKNGSFFFQSGRVESSFDFQRLRFFSKLQICTSGAVLMNFGQE